MKNKQTNAQQESVTWTKNKSLPDLELSKLLLGSAALLRVELGSSQWDGRHTHRVLPRVLFSGNSVRGQGGGSLNRRSLQQNRTFIVNLRQEQKPCPSAEYNVRPKAESVTWYGLLPRIIPTTGQMYRQHTSPTISGYDSKHVLTISTNQFKLHVRTLRQFLLLSDDNWFHKLTKLG